MNCTRCDADFRPSLTDGACPVCGRPADGFEGARRLDGDTRVYALVGVATIANLLLLAWLAVLHLQS